MKADFTFRLTQAPMAGAQDERLAAPWRFSLKTPPLLLPIQAKLARLKSRALG